MASRAAILGCGLLALLFTVGATQAGAASTADAPRASGGPNAGVSIINGRTTSIQDWPWQVALTFSRRASSQNLTSRRFFCGGSILAPRLVVTAGHCVAEFGKRDIRNLEVISGRTRLNSRQGEVARVTGLSMPRDSSGKRRYRTFSGAADWDIALLRLGTPLSAQPIKLAGPDEADVWTPGQIAWTTGWGVTKAFANRIPAELKVARQVIMNDRLCRRADGHAFRPATMLCAGGPGGNASACNGDSGGPLVVATSDGYRLVGVTSFGDGACRGFVPSVDARISGDPIRNWVARTAKKMSGVDVVGSGAVSDPVQPWCKIPAVFGVKPAQAQLRLESKGCRLGKVRTDPWGAGRSGRIIGFSRFPGWFAPIGFKLNVWVAP